MIFGTSRIHLFVICGLSSSALVLGHLSLSVKFDVPKRKDHPYKEVQVDGCYQIFGKAYLDRPGCYVLRNDVFVEDASEGFLSIYSDNVDLDLNGKTVAGPGAISTQAGIYVGGGHGIILRNGTIKNFMFGIRGETGPNGHRLEKISVKNIDIANASIIGIKLDAVDVSLIDVRATSQKDATDSRWQYLFDISVDATNCIYIRTAAHFHRETLESPFLIRLPEDCRKSD